MPIGVAEIWVRRVRDRDGTANELRLCLLPNALTLVLTQFLTPQLGERLCPFHPGFMAIGDSSLEVASRGCTTRPAVIATIGHRW